MHQSQRGQCSQNLKCVCRGNITCFHQQQKNEPIRNIPNSHLSICSFSYWWLSALRAPELLSLVNSNRNELYSLLLYAIFRCLCTDWCIAVYLVWKYVAIIKLWLRILNVTVSTSFREVVKSHFVAESSSAGARRDHFVYAHSQLETRLQCNLVSHWLGAYTTQSLPPAKPTSERYYDWCLDKEAFISWDRQL